MNVMGLGDPVGFENLDDGRASQRKISELSFDVAGFGHGAPIARDASMRFRAKWGKVESREKSAARVEKVRCVNRRGKQRRWAQKVPEVVAGSGENF
jgi:hypothetical protein